MSKYILATIVACLLTAHADVGFSCPRHADAGAITGARVAPSVGKAAGASPSPPLRGGLSSMHKVNAPLRTAWAERRPWNASRQTVECFVKIDGPFDDGMAAILKQVGFQVRSIIPQEQSRTTNHKPRTTTLLTGSLPLSQISELAHLAFVTSIEGAVPMGKKMPRGLK